MTPRVAFPGDVYGLLTVVSEAEPERRESKTHRGGWQTYRCVVVRCTCGTVKVVRVASLTRGYTRSCGEAPCWHWMRQSQAPDKRRSRKGVT